ncbi:serine/threonine-protein phosphatase 7 long form-like protein [Senna tora]|uniref:Serine/threonine-protein phosphatase 7 long form-like protein n=1 Tax=Senna tora TaxID=362788 RepID=A0A834WFJ2_9FABA|nr:serine/threonine-protein phosphatase 7 long form-like protein [Senna tora]
MESKAMYGNWENSYRLLPMWLAAISHFLPGTTVRLPDIMDREEHLADPSQEDPFLIAYFAHVVVHIIESPSHLLQLFHTLYSLAFMGECTITLEDAAIQLGFPCTGMAVTGLTEMNWPTLCEELLDLAEDANDAHVQQFARAYILHLIEGYLMLDKSSRNVYLMYLPLLNSFKEASKLSWGSTVLAYLYRELYRGNHYDWKDIGGCTTLLHLWAWERFP